MMYLPEDYKQAYGDEREPTKLWKAYGWTVGGLTAVFILSYLFL